MSAPDPEAGHSEGPDEAAESHCECGHGHAHGHKPHHEHGSCSHGQGHDHCSCGHHGCRCGCHRGCPCGCHGGHRSGRRCPCKGGALLAILAIAIVIVGVLAAPRARCGRWS